MAGQKQHTTGETFTARHTNYESSSGLDTARTAPRSLAGELDHEELKGFVNLELTAYELFAVVA